MPKLTLPPAGLSEDILIGLKDENDEMQIVTFTLNELYGVPISQVYEIIRVGSITNVPNSPSYMEGVINLRGKVLPVLNLRKRLKLPPVEISKTSRVMVTEAHNKIIGLLVDSVSHVLRVPPELVETAPEEVLEIDTDYITGVAKLKNQLVILLDLEKLLKREKIEITEVSKNGEQN